MPQSIAPGSVLTPSEIQAVIHAGGPEDLALRVEAAVLDKLRRHDIEGVIDRAYNEFVAMRAGTGEFLGDAWDERDAFKAHMRRFAYASYHDLIGQVLHNQRGGAQS